MERILCKLTDSKDKTRNNTQWGENITHTATGKGDLCSNGWIHYYDSPLLAVLLNPIHGNFKSPNLWKVKVGDIVKKDNGLKFGTTSLTTLKRVELPIITMEQRALAVSQMARRHILGNLPFMIITRGGCIFPLGEEHLMSITNII